MKEGIIISKLIQNWTHIDFFKILFVVINTFFFLESIEFILLQKPCLASFSFLHFFSLKIKIKCWYQLAVYQFRCCNVCRLLKYVTSLFFLLTIIVLKNSLPKFLCFIRSKIYQMLIHLIFFMFADRWSYIYGVMLTF